MLSSRIPECVRGVVLYLALGLALGVAQEGPGPLENPHVLSDLAACQLALGQAEEGAREAQARAASAEGRALAADHLVRASQVGRGQ